MSNRPKLSIYMLTFNNDRTVERALQSVVGFADEIIVVDSLSTDKTPEIARKYASRFIQRPWPGFRDQYQFASEQCTGEWVMFIDADEEIPEVLRAEILAELENNAARPETERVAGYEVHRRTFFLGRWIRHGGWVPDHETRLYDPRRGGWKGALHAKVHVDGRVAHLGHVYYHYTYKDIGDQIKTIDRYSDTDSDDQIKAGKPFALVKLLVNPLWRFGRDYVLKRGFLDGMPGFIIAVNTAFYVFVKNARLWEKRRVSRQFPEKGFYGEDLRGS
jgi:glycosyltransferase involved in cell wall biosynthesis